MADEKRLTAAEVLQQQQQREAAARQAEQAKRESDSQRRAEAAQHEAEAVAAQLKSSWYKSVVEASARDQVRFVVIAQVIEGSSGFANLVGDLIATIQQAGFFPEVIGSGSVASIDERGQPLQRGLSGLDAEAREVILITSKLRGWMPARLPKIGSSGGLQYLIVKWS